MITKRPLVAVGFLLPGLAIYALLTLYPLISGLWLSLTNSEGGRTSEFIGFANYLKMFGDPAFQSSTRITIQYAVIVVAVQTTFGLMIARALFSRPRVRRPIGLLILLPTLVAPLMASFIFSYLLAPDGALNQILDAIGLHGFTRVWLGDPETALVAVASVNIWMFTGLIATIFLAGYLAIPADLLDAASVDGAGGWTRFRTVEWPLLAPSLTVVVTISVIGTLRVFEFPLVLTNGGPAGSTTTLTMVIFRNTFQLPGQFAYGIAIAAALLVIVVVIASVSSSILRVREDRI